MSQSAAYYQAQAAKCDADAATTMLDNQREILLRSKAAWLALAAREIGIQEARAKRLAEAEQEKHDAE